MGSSMALVALVALASSSVRAWWVGTAVTSDITPGLGLSCPVPPPPPPSLTLMATKHDLLIGGGSIVYLVYLPNPVQCFI